MISGKYYIGVKIGGKKYDIHRLIAQEKIGRPLARDEVVHHINGNITDNRPENLAVMTRSQHARLHATGKRMSEEAKAKCSIAGRHPHYGYRKFSDEQVREIREDVHRGNGLRKVARWYGVDHCTISKIVSRETYADVI